MSLSGWNPKKNSGKINVERLIACKDFDLGDFLRVG